MVQRYPVPGIPPVSSHGMYKVDQSNIGVRSTATLPAQPLPEPPCDFHPVCPSLDNFIFLT